MIRNFALAAMLAAAASGAAVAAEGAKKKSNAPLRMVEMPFDDAAKGLLIRSIPLRVALPDTYV
ncbi:MAG: hypothetical protein ABIV06_06305, partial [Thermoanaerobaculia bacterium]